MIAGGNDLGHVIVVETGPGRVIAEERGLGLVIGVGIDRGRGGEKIATLTIERRRNHQNLRTSKSVKVLSNSIQRPPCFHCVYSGHSLKLVP